MLTVRVFHDPNLGQYAAHGWDVHKIATGRIATISGRTFTLTLPLRGSTIGDVKRLIEDQEGIPCGQQMLRSTARVLADAEPIEVPTTLILVFAGPPQMDEAVAAKPTTKFHGGGMCRPRPETYATQTMTVMPEEEESPPQVVETSPHHRMPSDRTVIDRQKMAAAVEARLRKNKK